LTIREASPSGWRLSRRRFTGGSSRCFGDAGDQYYGLAELGWIIEMVAYVSVNVVFFGGAEFESSPPLGTTGRERYVKVVTMEEAAAPEMHNWIKQAGGVTGWT
jgi:hypothetical protein